jgi:hypothetical protein
VIVESRVFETEAPQPACPLGHRITYSFLKVMPMAARVRSSARARPLRRTIISRRYQVASGRSHATRPELAQRPADNRWLCLSRSKTRRARLARWPADTATADRSSTSSSWQASAWPQTQRALPARHNADPARPDARRPVGRRLESGRFVCAYQLKIRLCRFLSANTPGSFLALSPPQ